MRRVLLFDRIADVDRDRWDALSSDPLTSHAALAALEEARLPGLTMRYAVVRGAGGSWLAGAPLACLDIDAEKLTHGLFRSVIGAARTVRPGFLRTRLCLCGLPVSVSTPPARIAAGAVPGHVLALLGEELSEFARERGAPWRAFKEFGRDDLAAAQAALEGAGYLLAPSEANCALALPWSRYEDFLGALRSHYRRAVRLAAARLREAGVTVDALPLAEAYTPDVHALYDAVRARAAVGLEWLNADYFRALGRAFGRDAVLLRFRRDGRVVGWVALLASGGRVVDLFHGIDYAERDGADLYFNQLAEVLRFAIGRRAASLSLGQSTLAAKTRFGGEVVPLWIALSHRSLPVQALLRAGRRLLFPEPDVPARRVFTRPEDRAEERAA